ncbi:VOC family protein [Humibacter sp.]|jgi:catechol 2,3-dioxygenase-like lactoylglutathione lyase family enzyme|uniref:VOC family protein n=1 Tax=Humibacter sp. TaxID=1940291 RepID=UPI002CC2E331|nr:VOC family protein [Humibacter sp.]HVX08032.1 VOC family protein [Humibacter sp.]
MTVAISGVHVLVDDPQAALSFYRDILGLTVKNEVSNGGFTWITLTTPSQPEIEIVLEQPHAGRSQENGDAVAALLAKGELQMLQLRTDDLGATFEKLAAASGVEVVQEPTDQFWGVRDAAVRDPSGNLIRIAQA